MIKSKWKSSSLILIILSGYLFLEAHEGHHVLPSLAQETAFFEENSEMSNSWTTWLNRIGRFHLIFIHFPIALITTTVLAELLWMGYGNLIFSYAARFMILAAAVFVVPTVLLGLAFSYGNQYQGLSEDLFVWHRYFGFLTGGLAIIAAVLKERYVRQSDSSSLSYYLCLFFLFITVSLAGAFGGSLTFGLDVW